MNIVFYFGVIRFPDIDFFFTLDSSPLFLLMYMTYFVLVLIIIFLLVGFYISFQNTFLNHKRTLNNILTNRITPEEKNSKIYSKLIKYYYLFQETLNYQKTYLSDSLKDNKKKSFFRNVLIFYKRNKITNNLDALLESYCKLNSFLCVGVKEL